MRKKMVLTQTRNIPKVLNIYLLWTIHCLTYVYVCYYYIVLLLIAKAKFTLSDNVMFRLIPKHNRDECRLSLVALSFTSVLSAFPLCCYTTSHNQMNRRGFFPSSYIIGLFYGTRGAF